jgi:hypothetical protein
LLSVSWGWGGAQPEGEVAEKKTDGEVSVTSKRGNTITKSAEPSDPAIAIERSGNNVVKNQSELEVEEKGTANKSKKTPNGKAGAGKTPNKKAAAADEDKPTAETPAKKESKRKAEDETEAPDAKRGRGRPKGSVNATTKSAKREEKPTRVSTREKKEPENLVKDTGNVEPKPRKEGTGRPGRPPKAAVAEEPAKKKKEAKPKAEAKAKVTKTKAAPTTPSGKKRGRPAGTGSAKKAEAKPKAVDAEGKPRGRGRPPKAK